MAWAMTDHDIPSKIFTIDPNNTDRKFDTTKNAWVEKIEPISGYAGEVMSTRVFPKIDFAYIDGWHTYDAVRHDFFATLNLASEKLHILFDDYLESIPADGVKKFTDEFLMKYFDVSLIETNNRKQVEEMTNEAGTTHFMCYLQINRSEANMSIDGLEIERILQEYRKLEKRWKVREKINKKIPLFKKIKFSKFIH
jgi:hypothetical protein